MSDVYIYYLVITWYEGEDDRIGPFSSLHIAEEVLNSIHEDRRQDWHIDKESLDADWNINLEGWKELTQPDFYKTKFGVSKNPITPDRPKNVREFLKVIPTATTKEMVEYRHELICGPSITTELIQDCPGLRDYLDQKMKEMLND